MRKFLPLYLVFFIGCEWFNKPPTAPTNPESPKAPKVEQPIKPIEAEPQNGTFSLEPREDVVAIHFNPSYFPSNAFAVELIYDNVYLGYFPIKETILLPKRQGKRELRANLIDADNKKIGPMRTFIVNNP